MILESIKQHSEIIISGLSVAAAIASAWAAIASRDTAAKALEIQRRMSIYEQLKSTAEKANSHSKGKKGADWDFNDAANIVRCLSLAMIGIQNYVEKDNQCDIKELKQLFLSQLNIELFEELNYQVGPDAFFRGENASSMTSDLWFDWIRAIKFFNFMVATVEDLED